MNKKIDADELWKVAWTYIKTVVDTVREPFVILNGDLKVLSANKTFYNVFQVKEKETINNRIYNLGNGQWNIPKLKILLEDILPKNTFFEDFKVEHNFPKIGHKVMVLNARRVHFTGESEPIMLLAMEDITYQKKLEDQLKEYTKKLSREVTKRTLKLETRVAELERVNKLLINREKEIEKLK